MTIIKSCGKTNYISARELCSRMLYRYFFKYFSKKRYSQGKYHSLINVVLVLVLHNSPHHVPKSAVIVTHTVLRNIYEHNIFHTGLVIQDARQYVNGIAILFQIMQHKLKVISFPYLQS
jgi:hypothetical protein